MIIFQCAEEYFPIGLLQERGRALESCPGALQVAGVVDAQLLQKLWEIHAVLGQECDDRGDGDARREVGIGPDARLAGEVGIADDPQRADELLRAFEVADEDIALFDALHRGVLSLTEARDGESLALRFFPGLHREHIEPIGRHAPSSPSPGMFGLRHLGVYYN